ncbi:MAG: hypothetical protein M3T96_04515 [Acidobacteriota bacterium]|nr:hypothetical protein [Acidobacteriota bacterium]
MKEQFYDQQKLNEYLLGSLPAAEAERYDERSFTDENFNDALNAAEQDLVDGYARNELNGATLEKFNAHYLASPVRREKAEFAKALQIYAEKNVAETAANNLLVAEPKRKNGGFFSNLFTIQRPILQWSLAFAALALLFTGGWLWLGNSRLQSEMSRADANREQLSQRETELAEREKQLEAAAAVNRSSADSKTERELAEAREERARLEDQLKKQRRERQKLAEQRVAAPTPENVLPRTVIASFTLAPSLRGGGKIRTVSISSRAATVAAGIELETNDYTAYRAVLRSQSDNRILWQSGKLKSKAVGGNFRLRVNFPAALLKPEIYSIEVSGIPKDGAAEIISDYSFRVVP